MCVVQGGGSAKKMIHLSSLSSNTTPSRKPSLVFPKILLLNFLFCWTMNSSGKGHEQSPFVPDYDRPSGIG